MNLAHLRYARAVVREGSFSAAARACAVTQPALSNGIAALERTLGGRLFDRTTRGTSLTSFGKRMLPLVDAAVQALDAVRAEARLAAVEGPRPLRVGVSTLVDRDLLGRAVEVAGTELVLRAAPMAQLHRELADSALDLVLVPAVSPPNLAAPEAARATVARVPIVFLPTAGGGADRDAGGAIELRETTRVPLILPTDSCGLAPFTRELFAAAGIPLPCYPGKADDCRVVQDWVTLGLGSALLPGSKVTDSVPVRSVVLDGTPIAIDYEARWLPDSPARAEIARIVRTLGGPAAGKPEPTQGAT
ncbi:MULTISPECIES: LysR family transcriptional regulator [Pseudofrankia]|uniref:LysR family transcriptional regulator n=1 Tax=Pseudofrankia TaxID=2994363 RepID=UPI000234CA4E|nr:MULTISPECIES: LysR family transcriptional regulator [Pseudofrankia]OHV41517.1 hypothetical protein BCD49_00735 [Pseudofrankia sp. EUN1h]